MSESGHTESFPPASNLPSKFVPPATLPSRPPARSRGESVASSLSLRVRRLSKGFAGSSTATMSNPTHERPSAGHNEATIMEDMGGSADANTTAAPGNSAGEHSKSVPGYASGAENKAVGSADDATLSTSRGTADSADAVLCEPFDNGYHFPPKYSAKDSFRHGLVGFWNYFTTPLGFFVVIYGLNVVAWGGMLFLLLCNASPAMCYPTCDDINSPRRKWIEWDSQILNALFCVTGFGLAPWRIRDMYYLGKFRLFKQHIGLRRLAGIHRGWFRLAGSQDLPVDVGPDHIPDDVPRDAIPYPDNKIPTAPLTGRRAPPTKLWKMDFILWMNMWNTFFQCCLCGFMWGMDRYTRPSWSTGLFVALDCIVGAIGGLGMFFEGKTVKGIEGVPLTDEGKEKLARDSEHGIHHINYIKAMKPKEKVGDAEANTEKASKRARLGLGSLKDDE